MAAQAAIRLRVLDELSEFTWNIVRYGSGGLCGETVYNRPGASAAEALPKTRSVAYPPDASQRSGKQPYVRSARYFVRHQIGD